MPWYFRYHHDMILKNFIANGREKLINKMTHLWGCNKQGFCFSLNLVVKVVPAQKNFELMALIHKLDDNDYVITDTEGEIVTLGIRASNILEISISSSFLF